MIFTEKQIEMLDDLQLEFGVPDAEFRDISRYQKDYYESHAHGWLTNHVLTHWANHKLAQAVDWDELDRLQREEAIRKLAERAQPVRDNIVGGAFNQLLARVRTSDRVGSITYVMEKDFTNLTAYDDADVRVFTMGYDPEAKTVTTTIGSDSVRTEDVYHIHGNASPRTQLKGLDELLNWLDGLDANS